MNKELIKAIKSKDLELVAVDKETADKIKKICKSSGSNPSDIINAAVQVLEKALGREIVVKSKDSNWNLKINHFKKFNKVTDINPN